VTPQNSVEDIVYCKYPTIQSGRFCFKQFFGCNAHISISESKKEGNLKYQGEKQKKGGDNGGGKGDLRPFQISCVSRVLVLKLVIVVIQI